MSDERLITAAIVTTGEKSDGKYLQELIEKSQETGMEIETVIGDTAYSEKENIQYAKENELQLVSKLNPQITQGGRTKEDEFEFNKDAGMYVCKAGHMAIRKARTGKKKTGKNQRDTYYFDIEKCKICPFKEGCYKEGAKSKTYSVTIKSTEHKEQEAFQESEEFKEKAKERYKIEAKNSELKHRHGYDVATILGSIWHANARGNGNIRSKSQTNNDLNEGTKKKYERKRRHFVQIERNVAFFNLSHLTNLKT